MAKSDAILLGDLPPEISGQSGSSAPLPSTGVAGEAASTNAASWLPGSYSNGPGAIKVKNLIPAVRRRTRHPGAQGNLEQQPGSRRKDAQHHACSTANARDKFGIQRRGTGQ